MMLSKPRPRLVVQARSGARRESVLCTAAAAAAALPPHAYDVAERAYRRLQQTDGNQAVFLMGESGAGKTACAQQVLEVRPDLTVAPPGGDSERREVGIWAAGLKRSLYESGLYLRCAPHLARETTPRIG